VSGEGSLFDVPPAAIGRFRVLHQVGAGTSGPVFRATHPDTSDALAIKLITVPLAPERVDTVAAAFAALIGTTDVARGACPVIDAGVHGASPYLVMAFVPGDSLDVALKQFGPAVIADVVPRLRVLARALDAAAAHDLLHGALHPRDILVSDSTTCVTGIGVWPALARQGERFPLRRPYRAPELTDATASAAGDAFALATLTYEWMTGRRPASAFVAGDMAQIPGASRDSLGHVFARALHADPEVRFPSCEAFVDELAVAGAIEAEAVAATPPRASRADSRARRKAARASGPPVLPLETFPAEADRPVAVEEPDASTVATIDAMPSPGDIDDLARDVTPPPSVRAGDAAPAARPDPLDDQLSGHAEDRFDARGPLLLSEPPPSALSRVLLGVVIGLLLGLGGGYLVWGRRPADVVTPPRVTEAAPPVEGPAPSAAPAPTPAPTPSPVTLPSTAPEPASPAPTDSATEKPATASGNLLVRSTPPGAAVFVDGTRRGATPLTLQQVALGTRRVRLQRDGYTTEERQVTLTEDRPSRSLDIRLTRAAPPARTAAPAPAATARTGSLVVESRPTGAAVLLNGKPVGTTPLTLENLTPGDYSVRLQLAGHRPVTTTVRVVAGTRQRAAASLVSAQEPE
jgi:serine/threonine protein kinase